MHFQLPKIENKLNRDTACSGFNKMKMAVVVVTLPPVIAGSPPGGRRVRRKCDDCSSCSARWCLSTVGRSAEWWSSGPESCEWAPWYLHRSLPEGGENRGALSEVRTSFLRCFLPISKGMFGRELVIVASVTVSSSRSLRYLKAQRVRTDGSVFMELQTALLVSWARWGSMMRRTVGLPGNTRSTVRTKGVRSPSGSPLKQLCVELNLLFLISHFDLHLLHPPVCS